ncbi:uncharacterized protein LOC131281368 isoform X2 [Anopheles ziemanni]|uniref:uncharacterized protein LOC131262556 isoform X2 n=1 Tax=Anopheles coustani TaxID=139045 RepID=UPI00265833EA|nr:uncharacterized protein LOC131262556 isoform X2 [Anopheles coustani]XP_058166679.1 uncharacterized protein LOC131281368 isoform X2 [Anopheles ziemanni]
MFPLNNRPFALYQKQHCGSKINRDATLIFSTRRRIKQRVDQQYESQQHVYPGPSKIVMRQFIDYGFNNKCRKVSALLVLTVVERLLLVEAMISETRQDIQAKIMLESQGRPIFPLTVSTRDELYAMMMQTLCSPQDAANPMIQDEQQARKQVYSMVAR